MRLCACVCVCFFASFCCALFVCFRLFAYCVRMLLVCVLCDCPCFDCLDLFVEFWLLGFAYVWFVCVCALFVCVVVCL